MNLEHNLHSYRPLSEDIRGKPGRSRTFHALATLIYNLGSRLRLKMAGRERGNQAASSRVGYCTDCTIALSTGRQAPVQ